MVVRSLAERAKSLQRARDNAKSEEFKELWNTKLKELLVESSRRASARVFTTL
jgi:hypothetical protein